MWRFFSQYAVNVRSVSRPYSRREGMGWSRVYDAVGGMAVGAIFTGFNPVFPSDNRATGSVDEAE